MSKTSSRASAVFTARRRSPSGVRSSGWTCGLSKCIGASASTATGTGATGVGATGMGATGMGARGAPAAGAVARPPAAQAAIDAKRSMARGPGMPVQGSPEPDSVHQSRARAANPARFAGAAACGRARRGRPCRGIRRPAPRGPRGAMSTGRSWPARSTARSAPASAHRPTPAPAHAKICFTTFPCTSVSRWSRPPWRKVSPS